MRKRLQQQFCRRRVTQKTDGAGRQAIGARLEDDHQVADLRTGHLQVVSQQVQGRAERADYGGQLPGTTGHPIADQYRIVLAQHLAKVARCRQVLVQTSIGHQEDATARHLAIDNPGDIDARLADQIAAQFNDQRCTGEVTDCRLDEAVEVCVATG